MEWEECDSSAAAHPEAVMHMEEEPSGEANPWGRGGKKRKREEVFPGSWAADSKRDRRMEEEDSGRASHETTSSQTRRGEENAFLPWNVTTDVASHMTWKKKKEEER